MERTWSAGVSSNRETGVVPDDHGSRWKNSAHLLMIPYPAQPHILPMLDLARQLASLGDITITFLSFQVLIDRILEGGSERGSDAIHFVGVPDDRPGFDQDPQSEVRTFPKVLQESLQLRYNMEPLLDSWLQKRESLGIDQEGPTCLVVDFIHWWSIDVAARFSIPRYVLVVISACYLLTLLSWHKNGKSDGVIDLPGLPSSLNINDNLFLLSHKDNERPAQQIRLRWPNSVMESDGVLLNTWLALDSPVIDSLHVMLPENVPLLAVGPLGQSLASSSTTVSMEGLQLSDEAAVSNWLDQQPPLSVLYISFGTTGMDNLTKRHVHELAKGLETSQQRFMWVLRAPPDVRDIADALPPGFEKRVKGRGLLLTGWAPQKQILAHPSTGAFLSSCGSNSALESLSRGVPLIGWPSFADQPIVSRYLDVIAKVAIDLPRQANHFVKAEDIEKAIRVVLQSEEGRAMRERAGKLNVSIAKALAQGGSSYRAVEEFADLIRHRPAPT